MLVLKEPRVWKSAIKTAETNSMLFLDFNFPEQNREIAGTQNPNPAPRGRLDLGPKRGEWAAMRLFGGLPFCVPFKTASVVFIVVSLKPQQMSSRGPAQLGLSL